VLKTLNKFCFKFVIFLYFIIMSVQVNAFPADSIYNLDLMLLDKDGNEKEFNKLSGKIQVFAMIYTNCKTICPIIIANMKAIEKLIPENDIKNVNFSLITLDPGKDDVKILNKYFKNKKFNNKIWNLYRTTKEDTLKVALTLGLKYKKEKNNEYTHSNLIILLDDKGVVKIHHQGLDKNYSKMLKTIAEISADLH